MLPDNNFLGDITMDSVTQIWKMLLSLKLSWNKTVGEYNPQFAITFVSSQKLKEKEIDIKQTGVLWFKVRFNWLWIELKEKIQMDETKDCLKVWKTIG